MPPIRAQAIDRIRCDHEYLIELAQRIQASCPRDHATDHCNECHPDQRQLCHGNINDLIRLFVETTQKHNLYEGLLMKEEGIPQAHRIAHSQAHLALAEQMKAIRAVFSADGDCVVAIEGIDGVLKTLMAHNTEYDLPLEAYLLSPA